MIPRIYKTNRLVLHILDDTKINQNLPISVLADIQPLGMTKTSKSMDSQFSKIHGKFTSSFNSEYNERHLNQFETWDLWSGILK